MAPISRAEKTANRRMARIVMKFGGTSVADVDRMRRVAAFVKREADAGHSIVVAVSAMAGETNRLVALCADAGPPDPALDVRNVEYDAVVASGEQVTSGLLAITSPDRLHAEWLSARRARLACSMRGFLKAPDNADHGAGAPAGARFFAAHAYRSCRRADATEKPLSFVGVSLAELQDAGAMAEVARTAARLVRAEDMIAKLSAGKLIVMLRDARERDAARIAARLEGVISGTLHRSKPEIARVMTAAIERAAGDDLETVIARLLKRQQDQSRIAGATT